MVRPRLAQMNRAELDTVIQEFEQLAKEEAEKSLQHSHAFLIEVYVLKARALSSQTSRLQRFLTAVDFSKLEGALGCYRAVNLPFEYYFEWLCGLEQLAELYHLAGKESEARRTLRAARDLSDDRGHPCIVKLNARIRERLRR